MFLATETYNPITAAAIERNPILGAVFDRVKSPDASPEFLRAVIAALGQAVKIHEYEELVICEKRLIALLSEL